jgi:hypothetical protein
MLLNARNASRYRESVKIDSLARLALARTIAHDLVLLRTFISVSSCLILVSSPLRAAIRSFKSVVLSLTALSLSESELSTW